MKSFISAVVVAIVVAVAAYLVLDRYQAPVNTAYATTGVRL